MDRFVDRCDAHRLQINTEKAVEMLVDPRSIGDCSSVTYKGVTLSKQIPTNILGFTLIMT